MKKLLSALVVSMSIAATCSAIAPDQVALGGVNINAKSSYLESIYGKPSKVNYRGDFKVEGFYGTTLKVSYWATIPFGGEMLGMDTMANNGFSTPAGISVGMDENIIKKTYGHPDEFKTGMCVSDAQPLGRVMFGTERKRNCYVYKYQYPSYPRNILALYFECANGKITRIGTRKGLDMSRG